MGKSKYVDEYGERRCKDCGAELLAGSRRQRCEVCVKERALQRRRDRRARSRELRDCLDCKVEIGAVGGRVRCEACAKEHKRKYMWKYNRKLRVQRATAKEPRYCEDCEAELPVQQGRGCVRKRCDACAEEHRRKSERERHRENQRRLVQRRPPRLCGDCRVELPKGCGSRRVYCDACAEERQRKWRREWAPRRREDQNREPRLCEDCKVKLPEGSGNNRRRCDSCAAERIRKNRREWAARHKPFQEPRYCRDCSVSLPLETAGDVHRLYCAECLKGRGRKRAHKRYRKARPKEPRYCEDCKVELSEGCGSRRKRCEACAAERKRNPRLCIQPSDLIQEDVQGHWVYVLRVVDDSKVPIDGKELKIGESKRLLQRLRKHRRDNRPAELGPPVALIPGDKKLEKALQHFLREYRMARDGKKEKEWFVPSPEVLRVVGILTEAFPYPRLGLTEPQSLLTPAEVLALLEPDSSEQEAAE